MHTCTCTYHTYVFNCFECVLGHFIFTLLVERVSADPRISLSRSCTRAPHYRWSSPSSFRKLSHVYFIFLSFYFYFCFWHFGASSFAYLFNLFQQQQQLAARSSNVNEPARSHCTIHKFHKLFHTILAAVECVNYRSKEIPNINLNIV